MEKQIKTMLISQGEVKSIFENINVAVELVEQAFEKYNKGNVLLPDKISQIFDQKVQNRINCMSASILDEKISGVKWVSVFPENTKMGMRNVSGIIVLSEIEHGLPLAVIDGAEITNIRTAGIGACAVKHLARKNSQSIGFIGAGREARAHLDSIKSVMPDIKKCYVSSRTEVTIEGFIEEESRKHSELQFINCSNRYEEAVTDADIIVTATSTQADILKAKWIKQGATYIHVGGWEDEFAVVEKADKIICDKWECVKHRGQTVCQMYKNGLLKDSDIYADFGEILSRRKVGRENDSEFIYFNSVGLAYIDVWFAKYVYDKAKSLSSVSEFEF